jgi:hypothetical protein
MNMKRAFFILLLGAVVWTAGAESPVPLRRFAMVAGSNYGGESLIRLKYAETDARSFAAVLQDLGGVRPQDLVLTLSPDLSRFEDAMGRVRQMVRSPREMDERRELVIYYSGHSDDEGLILGKDRYPWEQFRRDITDIPADVKIAILDSCSSGSLTRAKGGVARPAFLFDASSDMTGHAYLTSASAEEAAQESDRIGASFFTHYLISGLRGAADTVGDGVVTLNEAYAYAFQETLASTEKTEYGPQHAAYDINLTGSGDLVLTDLRSSAAGLTVAENIGGRLYFRDDQGVLAVELNKTEGQKTELGLEPGVYSVVLDRKGARFAAEVRVTTRQRGTLSMSMLRAVPLDKATARGENAGGQPPYDQAVPPEIVQRDPAAVLGASVGAAVGSAIGGAVGSAVSAAITAAAAATAVGPAAQQVAPPDTIPASEAPTDAGSEPPSREGGFPRPSPIDFTLLPDLSNGLFSSRADHVVGINLLIGSSSYSRGFEFGGLANLESRDVSGFQAAGLANVVLGRLTGFQAAGLVNYLGGEARFFQAAGLLNVSGGLVGAQTAGLGNVSLGAARGAQVAGLFNWDGVEVNGAQVAGAFNWGRSVTGPQISVVNVADTISGAQVGVVNIARHVSGTQVGLLNISEEIDGFPVGLVSVEAKGRHGVDLWVDMAGTTTAALSLGTRHMFTIFSVGWKPGPDPSLWSLGLGLGGRSHFKPFYLDYDLSMVTERTGFTNLGLSPMGALFPRVRAVVGLELFGGVAITAGAAVRILVPYLSDGISGANRSTTVFQPSIIVGLSI